jgi:hypothetical protein
MARFLVAVRMALTAGGLKTIGEILVAGGELRPMTRIGKESLSEATP